MYVLIQNCTLSITRADQNVTVLVNYGDSTQETKEVNGKTLSGLNFYDVISISKNFSQSGLFEIQASINKTYFSFINMTAYKCKFYFIHLKILN